MQTSSSLVPVLLDGPAFLKWFFFVSATTSRAPSGIHGIPSISHSIFIFLFGRFPQFCFTCSRGIIDSRSSQPNSSSSPTDPSDLTYLYTDNYGFTDVCVQTAPCRWSDNEDGTTAIRPSRCDSFLRTHNRCSGLLPCVCV